MIEFIEKEPYCVEPNGQRLLYPTYMLNDGKEYFIFNRVEPEIEWQAEENEDRKKQLIETDGAYFYFHGRFDDPIELLKSMAEKHQCFIKAENVHFGSVEDSEPYWHFGGNIKGLFGASFLYNIYDSELIEKIQTAVEFINQKQWSKALAVINSSNSKVKGRREHDDRL